MPDHKHYLIQKTERHLKSLRPLVWAVRIGYCTDIPDFVIASGGRVGGLEIGDPGCVGPPVPGTKEARAMLEMSRAGGIVACLNDFEDIRAFVDALYRGIPFRPVSAHMRRVDTRFLATTVNLPPIQGPMPLSSLDDFLPGTSRKALR